MPQVLHKNWQKEYLTIVHMNKVKQRAGRYLRGGKGGKFPSTLCAFLGTSLTRFLVEGGCIYVNS